jgi:hypothetical protein
MRPQMTPISPIEAHLRHLRNLWIKIQVIREMLIESTQTVTAPAPFF